MNNLNETTIMACIAGLTASPCKYRQCLHCLDCFGPIEDGHRVSEFLKTEISDKTINKTNSEDKTDHSQLDKIESMLQELLDSRDTEDLLHCGLCQNIAHSIKDNLHG